MTSLTKKPPSVTRCVGTYSVGFFGVNSLFAFERDFLGFPLFLEGLAFNVVACVFTVSARARACTHTYTHTTTHTPHTHTHHTHTHTPHTHTHTRSVSLSHIFSYLKVLPRASRIFEIQHAVRRHTFCPLFYMGVKLGRWNWGMKAGWGCLRIWCWGEYLGLGGTR